MEKEMSLYHKLPINVYYRLRFLKDYLFPQKDILQLSSSPRFWFLDAPSYGNLGDQAIAYALVNFLSVNFANWDIVEITEDKIIGQLKNVKSHIKPQDIIVLNGGGNFGNLYPRYEFIRRQIISSFTDNPIIIFPQSIYFTDTWQGQREAKISAQIYAQHSNLILYARDSQSCQIMKKLFPKNTILLCPDIVFSLQNIFTPVPKQNKVGVCLRDDEERTITSKKKEELFAFLETKFQKIETLTTLSSQLNISAMKRKTLVLGKLKEFANCQLIVTDRLHGLIFAYITHTPCLVLPSRTGKGGALYNDWLSKSSSVSTYLNGSWHLPKNTPKSGNIPLDFNALQRVLNTLIQGKTLL